MDDERSKNERQSAHEPRWPALALFLFAFCLLSARVLLSQEIAPDCTAADLDVSYQFANKSPTEQVGVNFRNISKHPCQLRPGAGVMFGDYRHGHNIWANERTNCDAHGNRKLVSPLTLAVGAIAHLVIAWETEPGSYETPFERAGDHKTYANACEIRYADVGASCQEGGQLNSYVNDDSKHGYDIWSDALLGDVCSTVRIDAYFPGAFSSLTEATAKDGKQTQEDVTINLTPSGSVLYSDDSFWLHTKIGNPEGKLTLNASSCPPLFLRTRASDGTTNFSQIGGTCRVTPAGQGSRRSILLDISTPGLGALMEPGERSVQVLALLGSPHAPEVKMVSSNVLTLHIVDPATIPRTWGPQTKGLAISLFLDKDTYAVGEDIPLRIAIENFSAQARIASGELPCGAGLMFEVRDSSGRAIKPAPGAAMLCTGHGWLIGYPRGKVVPVLGYTLRELGILPEVPGEYTVTATWNARSMETSRQQSAQPLPAVVLPLSALAPYAVVHSAPVTFHVIDQSH